MQLMYIKQDEGLKELSRRNSLIISLIFSILRVFSKLISSLFPPPPFLMLICSQHFRFLKHVCFSSDYLWGGFFWLINKNVFSSYLQSSPNLYRPLVCEWSRFATFLVGYGAAIVAVIKNDTFIYSIVLLLFFPLLLRFKAYYTA